MKKIIINLVMISCFVLILTTFAIAGDIDVQNFEIPTKAIQQISVNHEQGSIAFEINKINYFYYINANTPYEKIVSTSNLLSDIQKSTTVQIKHEPHGYHRKITNLLLFYGNRTIPDNLKEIPKKKEEKTK